MTEKRGRGRPRKHFTTSVDMETVEAQVAPARQEATEQLAQLAAFELSTQADIDFCGELLRDVRTRADALEAQRLAVAEPLTKAKKALDALFKPVRDVFEAMDALLVDKVVAFRARVQEAQQQALVAVEGGSRDPEVLALAHATPTLPEGFSEQVTYDVEVEDITAVPLELLQLNEKLVKAYVRERKGQVEIPGVRVISKVSLRRTNEST